MDVSAYTDTRIFLFSARSNHRCVLLCFGQLCIVWMMVWHARENLTVTSCLFLFSVKLPNVSASIPQLDACVAELRSKGYDVPLYPHEPKDDEERSIQARYATVLGSAVNPVLREGNSDRRVAAPVKAYAQKNPHKMGIWSKASRTHVSHMDKGDFFASEQSTTVKDATDVVIEHVSPDGTVTVLKDSTKVRLFRYLPGLHWNALCLCII